MTAPAGDRARHIGSDLPASLLVLASVAANAAGSGFAVPLIALVGPVVAAWLRIVIAGLVLAAVRPFWRPRANGAAWRAAVALGLTIAAMNTSFYAAIGRVPLGVAVALEFWGPLAVGVFGSRRLLDLLWVAFAAAGVFTLTGGRLGGDDVLGMALALAAGFFWAVYILVGARLGRTWPDGRGLGAAMVVAASVSAIPVLMLGAGEMIRIEVLGGGLVVALVGSVIPYSLQLASLRRLSTAAFGVLMSLDPALSAAIGFAFLGQSLDVSQMTAIGLIVVASAGVSVTRSAAG